MIISKAIKEEETSVLGRKISDYVLLIKLRLSSLVVFSAVITYLYASSGSISWVNLMLLIAGGFLVTGASNGINQILERDLDRLMDRTRESPLPTMRLG